MAGRKQPRALVKGSVLRWARESLNLTIEAAAKRLKLGPDVLRAWEAEQQAPSVPQLRKLADAYKRPLIVFYLPEPPKGFDAMRDFRRAVPEQARRPSPQLALEIRRMHELRDAAQDLAASIGEPIPRWEVGATLGSDPAAAARTARDRLGIPVEQQRKWRDSYKALRAWRDALEAAGTLVFQLRGIESDEARGFSIAAEVLPAIAINGKDAPNGRIFTLMHELGHLVLHADGRCGDILDDEGSDERGRIEAFCNAFAAELLLPRQALLEHSVLREHGRSPRWSLAELETLARDFSVSEEVVVRRLLELGRASEAFYREQRARLAGRLWNTQTGGGDPYRSQVARLGRTFIRLVFSGLSERQLSSVDAATLLGVKVSNFAKLQDEAFDGMATA